MGQEEYRNRIEGSGRRATNPVFWPWHSHHTQELTTSVLITQDLHKADCVIIGRKGEHETLSLPKGLLIVDSCWRRKTHCLSVAATC